ncbi:MAG: hypothetical protein WCT04_19695 [Planctomycetota bacterium]
MSDRNENLLVKQQKYRAQRIDPNYPSKIHSSRRWMFFLTRILPAIGFTAVLLMTFNPFSNTGRTLYEPGVVSAQHSFFNHRCGDCHESHLGSFGIVTNSKCRVCHDGPVHNANQVCPGGEKLLKGTAVSTAGKQIEEPRCASCHTEHKGDKSLVKMSDNHCTQCHADLKVQGSAQPVVTKSITGFSPGGGHDDWRILKPNPTKPGGNDPTQLRFNHKIHMKMVYDSSSPLGARQMECVDCHSATVTNLEPLPAETTRLIAFEKTILDGKTDEFYDGIKASAAASSVTRLKLTPTDLRKLTGAALDRPPLSHHAIDKDNAAALKSDCAETVVELIYERLTNTPARGETRYMIPVNYERNCATTCHAHTLPALKLDEAITLIPPHSTATTVRRALSNERLESMLQQSQAIKKIAQEKSPATPLIQRLRTELSKKAAAPILSSKDKSKIDAELIRVLRDSTPDMVMYVAATFKPDECSLLTDNILTPTVINDYGTLSKRNKKELNESLDEKVSGRISAFVDDSPAKLSEVAIKKRDELTQKLFVSKEDATKSGDRGACLFCHEPSPKPANAGAEYPVIASVRAPVRWLNQAVFNHETHRVVNCESCHTEARSSEKTSAVLLPGIQKCQECHKPNGARTDCNECHLYHDKSHQARDHAISIEDLMNSGAERIVKRKIDSK